MREKAENTVEAPGGPEICKLRLTYSKTGLIRFISHRDLIRVFFRAFSRAGLPVAHSRGYSPHPRASFCPPLKVGMEGLNELLDLALAEPADGEEAAGRINAQLPEGIRVRAARRLAPGAPSLNSRLEKAEYRVALNESIRVGKEAIGRFLDAPEVRVRRERRGGEEIVDARRGVLELEREGEGVLRMVLSLKENGRPYPVLSALSGADISRLAGLKWQRLGFPAPRPG